MHWTSCADSIKQYPSARIVWADYKQAQGGGAAECRYRWEVWSGPSLRRPASRQFQSRRKSEPAWLITKPPASHIKSPPVISLASSHSPRPPIPAMPMQCNARPRGEIFKGEILAKPSEPNQSFQGNQGPRATDTGSYNSLRTMTGPIPCPPGCAMVAIVRFCFCFLRCYRLPTWVQPLVVRDERELRRFEK